MDDNVSKHIESTLGTCGGKPRITGTRIRVQDIVVWTEAGKSPDEIVTDYPQLTISNVYAALAYYHDHREEIEQHMILADELVQAMMANPSLCEPRGKDARADSVPS